VNRTGEIWREYAGEYQDALGASTPSEGSRVLVGEEYRDVGVKVTRKWGVTVVRRMLIRRFLCVSVLVSGFANRSANREDTPDRLRPMLVAPAFSYDSDDVLPLAGGVLGSPGRTLLQRICYL